MKVVAIIPARGGSKRLKGKNIYPIWGKPMLYWAIKACEDSQYDIDVYVSTEDEEITKIAEECGAKVIPRPYHLASDFAFKQEVIRYSAKTIKSNRSLEKLEQPDIWISLQANSPEIKGENIDAGIIALQTFGRDEIISLDSDLMQNAAFRVFKGDYVFQEDLSTNCGGIICELHDVHNLEDVNMLEKKLKRIK